MVKKNISNQELFNFPCRFPIKVVGKNNKNFTQTIVCLIEKHSDIIHPNQTSQRLSKNGNYLALTVVIIATSKQQLDAIYTDLNAHSDVLYTL